MPFRSPITVREAVDHIHAHRFLLPAIQRELVWDTEQMARLFDSLMRDYPISSFLFWKVDQTQKDKFQFYEFLREYHAKTGVHNPKANVDGTTDVTAILDGQQRLTALYIGLRGTYADKIKWRHYNDPSAYPKKELFINLLDRCRDEDRDMEYDFRFLSKSESTPDNESTKWYRAGDVLNIDPKRPIQTTQVLSELGLERNEFATQCLFKLGQVVHSEPAINYFEEQEPDLDKVLRIFVRINSGGNPLSHSDLLLSIATSQWQHKDAREEIYNLVDELNQVRDRFTFPKEFVLKACLTLADCDVAFKVTNFNKANMLVIEKRWDDIATYLRLAVTLIADFGFNGLSLTSHNAIIPIAYYLQRQRANGDFRTASKFEGDRHAIRRWLTIALLRGTFGGQSDTTLRIIRDAIRPPTDIFPTAGINKALAKTLESLTFTEEEIDGLLVLTLGQRETFQILSLLYPHLDYRNQFHQDHIHPRSFFTSQTKLTKLGIPKEEHEFYIGSTNYIGNLQMLEGPVNHEKANIDFETWLNKTFPDDKKRRDFKEKNYIPDVDLSFANFKEFRLAREKLIVERLKQLLA